jgi:hypothetical protein
MSWKHVSSDVENCCRRRWPSVPVPHTPVSWKSCRPLPHSPVPQSSGKLWRRQHLSSSSALPVFPLPHSPLRCKGGSYDDDNFCRRRWRSVPLPHNPVKWKGMTTTTFVVGVAGVSPCLTPQSAGKTRPPQINTSAKPETPRPTHPRKYNPHPSQR